MSSDSSLSLWQTQALLLLIILLKERERNKEQQYQNACLYHTDCITVIPIFLSLLMLIQSKLPIFRFSYFGRFVDKFVLAKYLHKNSNRLVVLDIGLSILIFKEFFNHFPLNCLDTYH